MRKGLLLTVALALFVPVSNVFAGTISQYTNRAVFNANVAGPLTVEDFGPDALFPITTGVLNSLTNLPGIGIVPGYIQPGVTYSTPVGTGNFFNIDAGGGYTGGFLDGFNPSDRVLTITFVNAASAFGFDTGSLGGSSFDVTIYFSSGPSQSFNNAYPGSLQFFGFESSAADITSVEISNQGSFFGFDLDDFTFNDSGPTTVPEPSTLVTLVAGIGALAGWKRRK